MLSNSPQTAIQTCPLGSITSEGRSFVDLNDRSIQVTEDAVKLTPDSHPDMPSRLNNLGGSLIRRFERLGDLEDLNRSIQVFEDAVKLTPDSHPDMPSRLNNLGNSLLS
jgi:hypothetical protein